MICIQFCNFYFIEPTYKKLERNIRTPQNANKIL